MSRINSRFPGTHLLLDKFSRCLAQATTAEEKATTMVATRERINAWFSMANEFISESSWELAASHSGVTLSHRPSHLHAPGHLVRFEVQNFDLNQNAPDQACDVMVRPEVSGQMHDRSMDAMSIRWIKTLAPGDALVEQSSHHFFHRAAALLFGSFAGPAWNHFFYNETPVLARHQCRKNFPKAGDSTYACFQDHDGIGQENMMIWRKEKDGRGFRMVLVYSTPGDKWAKWASEFFKVMAQTTHRALEYYANRPGLKLMRAADANLYIILSLQNFRRGPPLLPAKPDEPEVITMSHERFGTSTWRRYSLRCSDFRCAQYLRKLTEGLGLPMETFDQLDGQPLVPYQCVVPRARWEEVRHRVLEVMRSQKSAYRFANGGRTAPSLIEEASAHFAVDASGQDQCSKELPTKVVVRKTFLEVDEEACMPSIKRSKSDIGLLSFFM